MGHIYKYNCICGYETEAHIGAGLQGVNLDLIGRYFPKDREIIVSNRQDIKKFILKNALVKCDKCKKIFVLPCLEYEYNSEEIIKIGECPTCKGIVDICHDIDNVTCPKCNQFMIRELIGHWD